MQVRSKFCFSWFSTSGTGLIRAKDITQQVIIVYSVSLQDIPIVASLFYMYLFGVRPKLNFHTTHTVACSQRK